jgi:hypothetical protein
LYFCKLDFVGEPYPEVDLWQWVLSVETTPMFLGGLSKLEDQGEPAAAAADRLLGNRGGARETPGARSEAPESLFEAVEEGTGALLGHSVHVV